MRFEPSSYDPRFSFCPDVGLNSGMRIEISQRCFASVEEWRARDIAEPLPGIITVWAAREPACSSQVLNRGRTRPNRPEFRLAFGR